MGMTTKHYEMVADTMAESLITAEEAGRDTLDITLAITALSIAFKSENPRFNENRFRQRVSDMTHILSAINADNYAIDSLSKSLKKETGLPTYRLYLADFPAGHPVWVNLSRLRQIEERQEERRTKLREMRSSWQK